MRPRLPPPSAILLPALALAAAATAAPPPPATPEAPEPAAAEPAPSAILANERIDALRRRFLDDDSRLYNADRSTTVEAPSLGHADRSTLLGFVDDLRTALETELGARGAPQAVAPAVSFRGAQNHVVLRVAPPAEPGPEGVPSTPPRVETRVLPYPVGPNSGTARFFLLATIEGDVAALDSRALAFRLVDGLLRLTIASLSGEAGNAPRPVPPPAWFSRGLAELLDPAGRQADYDAVRDLWFSAGLPPLPALLSPDDPHADSDPAIAAQIVAFWLSYPDVPSRFRDLAAALAGGTPWSAALFLRTSVGDGTDPFAADRAFDAWLYGRVRRILSLGATTPELVARTLVALQLHPGRDGVPADFADAPQPLERLLEPGSRKWAPAAASALRAYVLRQAAGRGDAFRAAAGQFADVLGDIAARGARAPRAAERLSAAREAMTSSATPAP